jgi:hypothetical protein
MMVPYTMKNTGSSKEWISTNVMFFLIATATMMGEQGMIFAQRQEEEEATVRSNVRIVSLLASFVRSFVRSLSIVVSHTLTVSP